MWCSKVNGNMYMKKLCMDFKTFFTKINLSPFSMNTVKYPYYAFQFHFSKNSRYPSSTPITKLLLPF